MSGPDSPPGPGRIVWLASFPKSGNTWMRAIVTALGTHPQLFAVNQLGSGSQPHHVGSALGAFGIDPRWFDRSEADLLRTALAMRNGAARPAGDVGDDATGSGDSTGNDTGPDGSADRTAPRLRKTHEVHRPGAADRPPFPLEATRAAILVVRDPRDVVCSYAPFFGLDLDDAVDAVGRDHVGGRGSPARATTAQPWGSWSSHTRSWLDPEVPFPVHLIRYEDLRTDAVATLGPVFDRIGLVCTQAQLRDAVEQSSFERLRDSEDERGFREVSPATPRFFRSGRSGGWRDELDDDQVAAIEADHGPLMVELGYELTTGPDRRARLGAARSSRRRQEQQHELRLPASLGIDVRVGPTPEHLDGGEVLRPWLELADGRALVSFQGIGRILVSGGDTVVVSVDPAAEEDDGTPSWILQGWATTIAALQRGLLSLHAAALDVDGRTIALAGRRRAGKSTTAMALRRAGHRLLVDDVTLVDLGGAAPRILPFQRNVHLLRDAAEAVGVDFDAMGKLAGGRPKAAFLDEAPPSAARALDLIVELRPLPDATSLTIDPVRGAERFAVLQRHTLRDGIAPRILGRDRYFDLLSRLASAVPMVRVTRPAAEWSLDDVVAAIESIPATDAPEGAAGTP